MPSCLKMDGRQEGLAAESLTEALALIAEQWGDLIRARAGRGGAALIDTQVDARCVQPPLTQRVDELASRVRRVGGRARRVLDRRELLVARHLQARRQRGCDPRRASRGHVRAHRMPMPLLPHAQTSASTPPARLQRRHASRMRERVRRTCSAAMRCACGNVSKMKSSSLTPLLTVGVTRVPSGSTCGIFLRATCSGSVCSRPSQKVRRKLIEK